MNVIIFFVGLFIGSGLGFTMASLLTIGHDSDLIDRFQDQERRVHDQEKHIRAQERHIRELVRRLQDAQATQL